MNNDAMPSHSSDQYPGIGRLVYACCILVLFVILVSLSLTESFSTAPMARLLNLGGLAISTFLTVLRLQNVGKSGWWVLLQFIPIINLYIAFLCFCAPTGYADSKELDEAGIIVIVAYIVLIIAILLFAFSSTATAALV